MVRLEAVETERVRSLYKEMERAGREVVEGAGVPDREVRVERAADMRYTGQGHEIRVPVPGGELDEETPAGLQAAFDEAYRETYGRTCEGVPVEAVHWRVTVSGPRPEPGAIRPARRPGNGKAGPTSRRVLFGPDTGEAEARVLRRERLTAGQSGEGPVVIEEAESTAVVPPGWRFQVVEGGALVLGKDPAQVP